MYAAVFESATMTINVNSIVAVLVDAPYWVLGTDYENYSVVWSCSNFGLFSTREFAVSQ